MSKKRIIFAVLCALLALVVIMTVVTAVKLVQMFNGPEPTEPTETEPSASESIDPSTSPSTQPSTEATVPPTTKPTVPPTTKPTSPSTDGHTHNFNTVLSSQAPTCTDGGYKELLCSCGETYWEVVSKLDHTFGYGETVAVTCTTDGYTRFTCSTCGYVDDRNVVEKTGHNYGSGVYHKATCTEDAYTVYTCANSNCPEKTKLEPDTAHPKTGHDFGGWVEKNGVSTQTCGNCNKSHSTEELEITNTMFLDSPDNDFRMHEIYVGTDLVKNLYHFKIQDFINNGSIKFSYDYDTGLTIKYKDKLGADHTVVLDPEGDDCTIEDNVTPGADPNEPDNNDPNNPGGGEPNEPDNNDPNNPGGGDPDNSGNGDSDDESNN